MRISEIVPADIVLLQAGSLVPADLRLIAAKDFFVDAESELVLLGSIAFCDPPKSTAHEAIGLLEKTGVWVKVLTGDDGLVTERVCRDVDPRVERMIAGCELAGLEPEAFAQAVEACNVFVKLSPAQKEQILEEMRRAGHVVGFMGDGIRASSRAADGG